VIVYTAAMKNRRYKCSSQLNACMHSRLGSPSSDSSLDYTSSAVVWTGNSILDFTASTNTVLVLHILQHLISLY